MSYSARIAVGPFHAKWRVDFTSNGAYALFLYDELGNGINTEAGNPIAAEYGGTTNVISVASQRVGANVFRVPPILST
jgi:hypothetical protein